MQNFRAMSRAEAKEYLVQFVAENEASIARLQVLCSHSGGPRLDYSPESLAPLWEWAVPRLRWRAGYQPPATTAEPGPRIDPASLEPPDQLPSWFHHPSGVGYERFSAETLWLIDGIGRYLGETVIRNIPGTRWRSGNARRTGYVYQNQPVVAGLDPATSPFNVCAVLAARRLSGRPGSLSDLFARWRFP